jgi:D-alanine-D-alanine ligase
MRVGVIFGGKSEEHAVSLASARSVVRALLPRHQVICLYVDRAGTWYLVEGPDSISSPQGFVGLLYLGGKALLAQLSLTDVRGLVAALQIDVAFPLIHGPYGEDGRLQGLLEMASLPYVGCDVTSSAVAMDKAVTKAVLQAAGIPQVPYRVVRLKEWTTDRQEVLRRLVDDLNLPVFVKPANLGSSVGVSRVEEIDGLELALDAAFVYDRKAVVERAVACRELECGILGHRELRVSLVGEVRPKGRFYDYESKYSPGGSQLLIPAPVPPQIEQTVKDLALASFVQIGASGMARVDFFYEETTGRVYVNEINTIPGFTETSMYPKLFEATGIPYADLLDQLISSALERDADART